MYQRSITRLSRYHDFVGVCHTVPYLFRHDVILKKNTFVHRLFKPVSGVKRLEMKSCSEYTGKDSKRVVFIWVFISALTTEVNE